jgi:hypothetical protein
VLAGFVGVLLMLRPTIEQHQLFAGVVGLLSGLLSAFAYLQVMALGKIGEPEARTVFYFAVGSAVAGAAGMAVTGVSPWDWGHALWLLPVGAAGFARPVVHDARLQPRRHAGGGQPAVLGHRVRRAVQRAAVRRRDPAGWAGPAWR